MKLLSLLFSCVFILGMYSVGAAQGDGDAASASGPVMTFESKVVDYGKIEQHSEPLRTVAFTNTGDEPLIISNARGSCGCTVPTWPKEPIMPGESSEIEIRYATNRLGKINKTVTLTTNEGGEKHVIKVVGHISKKVEEESVPTNKTGLNIQD